MFKLEKMNVVKIVATEHEKEKLINKGFTEVIDKTHKALKLNGDGEITLLSEVTEEEMQEEVKEKKEEKSKGKVAK
ncbi:hypothetical protein CIW83_18385 [Tissierella sp. P1]|uniref:hypothetical protein n=1 Tax=Tissierella sp. P1 TaxID=1280483 RepID=UPI000B9FA433|nr:hypothetical protein [Tissierella sp. P1]OZV10786.1 hypothetical protein CIW83_18385 [Tissierella sp. P1]